MSEAPDTTTDKAQAYIDIAERLRRLPPKTPDAASEMLGVRLKKVDRAYVGSGTGTDGVPFDELTFRFLPNGEPNLFIITLPDGAGPLHGAVMAAFEDLELYAVPRGRSEDEEMQVGRDEYWGRITFGFPENAQDHLRTIIYDYTRR